MTLYRKYRPQVFAEFIGQDLIKNIIQNEISMGKIAHAYLFAGPRGVGKTTMARLIAKAINCQNRTENTYEPCNNCFSCLGINTGSCLDLIEIDAASNRGIDDIRELKNNIRFAPAKSKYKVFIIDEVHMLTIEAFNALLKTLEEPPAHAIFILATTLKYKLPATIISRCQCFDFKKISEAELLNQLQIITQKEGLEIDQEVLQAIVKRADGSSRDGESILGQLVSLNLKKISWPEAALVLPRSDFLKVKEFVDFLVAGNLPSVFQLIHNLTEDGVDLERFTKDLIEYLRQELVSMIITSNQISTKLSLVSFYRQALNVFIEKLSLFKKDLEIQELPLEMAALEIFLNTKQHEKEHETTQKPNMLSSLQFIESQAVINTIQNKIDNQKSPVALEQNQIVETKDIPVNKTLQLEQNKIETRQCLVSTNELSLSLDDIKIRWSEILEAIKQHNHSLPVALNMCQPSKLEGGVLTLEFKFKLHADAVFNQKNREILETVISQVVKQKIVIKAVQMNNNMHYDAKQTEDTSSLKSEVNQFAIDILSVFDGDIVKEI